MKYFILFLGVYLLLGLIAVFFISVFIMDYVTDYTKIELTFKEKIECLSETYKGIFDPYFILVYMLHWPIVVFKLISEYKEFRKLIIYMSKKEFEV